MTPADHQALLSTEKLSVTKAKRVILTQVDLSIKPAEIVTIIGPNGAGKSTLVKALLRLEPTTSGKVVYRPDLKVGYMPQKLGLDASLPLTVLRFLTLSISQFRTNQQVHDRAAFLLDLVNAPQLVNRMLSQLSGGEFQRVLLARAMMAEPNLLILDEPAQGVDLTGQNQLYQLIGEIRDHFKTAVLMVSHDLHFVMASTDQVICLNQHVCCSGHPLTVSNDPAYRALFDAVPNNQLAIYNHQHDHRHELDGHIAPKDHSGCDHD